MLQFQSPLFVNLHVWLAILWVQLFYHLGSNSTPWIYHLINNMIFFSITYYISYLTFPIYELLGRFGNYFMHLWGIWIDLVSLLLTILNGILMHSNLSCIYLFEHLITSQVWLLYTYSIQISVLLPFQSPLVWILHVWTAILWVLLFYILGSISTWY